MKRSSLVLLLLLLPLSLPLPLAAESWSLAQLLALLATVEERKAEYHETQHMSLLDVPLESHGTLIFRAPDYLEKRVAGGGEGYRVEGKQLFLEKGDERRSLSLEEVPALAAFVASIRATLAGDRQTLERYYRISLEGGPEAWRMRLEPRQSEMAMMIRSITLHGSGDRITAVVTDAQGGDTTRMQLRQADGR